MPVNTVASSLTDSCCRGPQNPAALSSGRTVNERSTVDDRTRAPRCRHRTASLPGQRPRVAGRQSPKLSVSVADLEEPRIDVHRSVDDALHSGRRKPRGTGTAKLVGLSALRYTSGFNPSEGQSNLTVAGAGGSALSAGCATAVPAAEIASIEDRMSNAEISARAPQLRPTTAATAAHGSTPYCSSFVIPTGVGLYRRTSQADALLEGRRSHLES